jgi:protein gp37
MNKTNIPWCDRSWNPITGCTKISEGCLNCYAHAIAKRFNKGNFSVRMQYEKLTRPEHVRKPQKVFVCSMSDLFHEEVTESQFRIVLESMHQADWHQYILLTKRISKALERITHLYAGRYSELNTHQTMIERCWFGVTVENQARADERIPELLFIPSKVHFISVEPMLEPINIAKWLKPYGMTQNRIDWVIAGPETGPRKRPCKDEWMYDLWKQCDKARIPFFDKRDNPQMREYPKLP